MFRATVCLSSRSRGQNGGRQTYRPAVEILEARWTPSSTRFAVIGDYGLAGSGEQSVASLVHGWNPDFIITNGDNNYPKGEASTIDVNIGQYYHDYIGAYQGTYGAGSATNRFFPSLGNHDWASGTAQPYSNYFSLPGNERYYTYSAGPVQFFAVDSDPHEPDGTTPTSIQGQWLQTQLQASTATWKIVYFHHAAYSSGSHGGADYMRWPFADWGASAVLAGHNHIYDRLIVDGLPYIVNGIGGDSHANPAELDPNSLFHYGATFGAQLVQADDNQITFSLYSDAGQLIDRYTLFAGALPTVAVDATDAVAAPGGDTATFTVSRAAADLTAPLDVTYTVSGAAVPGTDYAPLSGVVAIPAGADSATVVVTPLAGAGSDPNEAVVISLASSTGYNVGAPGQAQVSIVASSTAITAPSNLTATALSATQAQLAWADNSSNEGWFRIERSLDGVTFSYLATASKNATAYVDASAPSGSTLSYRVRGVSSAATSFWSNVATVTMSAAALGAPTNLVAAAVSATQVNLTWRDNSAAETGFAIERSLDGTTFSPLATVGQNARSFSDDTTSPTTTYYYRVRAVNSSGSSAWSATASITTPGVSSGLAAPSNLQAASGPGLLVPLTWQDNSSTEGWFRIERAVDGGAFKFLNTAKKNASSYADTAVTAGHTYLYRLRAVNQAGFSDWSNIATATR